LGCKWCSKGNKDKHIKNNKDRRREKTMKHGDFTNLAKDYINRPGYSLELLKMIGKYAGMDDENFKVADVGAGTGKLTENLSELGLTGYAVEPNDAMRKEGVKAFEGNSSFIWSKGTAEETGLEDHCVNWVLMGSSFHWADTQKALTEFHRILMKGGIFTAIYNPRIIEKDTVFDEIEQIIYDEMPDMQRVSSASKNNHMDMEHKVTSSALFGDLIFAESPFTVTMSKERYMGIWRSVNDIQVQAGPEKFGRILRRIEKTIEPLDQIEAPYMARSWTVAAL